MRARRSEPAAVAAFLAKTNERRRSGWKAAVFLFSLFLVGLLCCGCGDESEEQAKALAKRGFDALKERKPETARTYFQRALTLRPAYGSANYGMARVLDQYYRDTPAALTYYQRFLDVAEEGSNRNASVAAVKALELLAAGKLEDPAAAAEEILLAAYAGKRAVFFERVAGSLLHARVVEGKAAERLLSELGAHSLGGKPEVAYRKITPDMQGAVVVLRLRSDSDSAAEYVCLLLVRGQGELAGLWQLSSSIPLRDLGKSS